jgi:hypothetical protein
MRSRDQWRRVRAGGAARRVARGGPRRHWDTGSPAQSAVLALRRANAEHLSVMERGRRLSPGHSATTVFIRDRPQREYDPARCLVHADRRTVSLVGATDAMQPHRLAQVRVRRVNLRHRNLQRYRHPGAPRVPPAATTLPCRTTRHRLERHGCVSRVA